MVNLLRFFHTEKDTLYWFWKDAVPPYRWNIVRINLLDFLATVTEIAAYGVIVAFVNKLQSNADMQGWLWNQFSQLTISEFLWYATLLATGSFIANAFFKYLFRKAAFDLSRAYDTFCVLRLVNVLQPHMKGNPSLPSYAIKKAIIKDSRVCGSLLRSMSSFVIPLLKILLSLAYMFYISVWITLIMVAMLWVTFYFLQRLGQRVIKTTQDKERLQPLSIRNIFQLLQVRGPGKAKLDHQHSTFGDEVIDEYYATYYRTRILANQNLLIIKLSIAAMTFLILLVAGNYMLWNHMHWGILISFVLAMQIFFRSLYGLAGIAKQISSKFDYISHYHFILKAAGAGDLQTMGHILDEKNISLQMEGDEDEDDDDFSDF